MEIIVESSNYEKKRFGNLETAVEYMRHRVAENFTVYVNSSEKQKIIDRIRKECSNILSIK